MDSIFQISNPSHMDFVDLVLTFETELCLFYVSCRERAHQPFMVLEHEILPSNMVL